MKYDVIYNQILLKFMLNIKKEFNLVDLLVQ